MKTLLLSGIMELNFSAHIHTEDDTSKKKKQKGTSFKRYTHKKKEGEKKKRCAVYEYSNFTECCMPKIQAFVTTIKRPLVWNFIGFCFLQNSRHDSQKCFVSSEMKETHIDRLNVLKDKASSRTLQVNFIASCFSKRLRLRY